MDEEFKSDEINLRKQGSSGYSETTHIEKVNVLDEEDSVHIMDDIENMSNPEQIKKAHLAGLAIRKHT